MWAACRALSDGSMMPSVTTALNLKQAICCMHPCKPAVLLRPHRRPDRVRGVLGVPLGGEEAACLPCALAACAAPLGTLQAYRVITSHMCQLASPSAAPTAALLPCTPAQGLFSAFGDSKKSLDWVKQNNIAAFFAPPNADNEKVSAR